MEERHQHICPRNCYDTCSMISTVRGGILLSVEGNPAHEYTQGKLCAKALDDVQRVYDSSRISYPMRQRKRFSGYWDRITWDEALDDIARNIIKLKRQYGNTLALALNKYSGNFGILHNATDWLFSCIGNTTRAIGSPCWSAGVDAQTFDFGAFFCSDPLDMANSNLILLWGVNPAWTAPHQMNVIFKAIDNGAKVICLDTHFSATAARSHQFIQVNPGTDGLLALSMAKIIVEESLTDPHLEKYTLGSEQFINYLRSEIHLDDAVRITGVSRTTIEELARSYALTHPACIWIGFGLQRYTNGGQTVRAIDALGALAGHIGESGGGVQYGHFETWQFLDPLKDSPYIKTNAKISDNSMHKDRHLNINLFAHKALQCNNPPIKMLWLSGRNPFAQDADLHLWHNLVKQLDLVVISDIFMSKSAEAADIFLPVTTHYEHWDLHASYWHYWVGINEPAISPVGEARSDLQIAWDLSRTLNRLEPGSCSFPTQGSEKNTITQLIGSEMLKILDLSSPEEIFKQPVRSTLPPTSWNNKEFRTPSGHYEFSSSRAKKAGFPSLPIYIPPCGPSEETPLRLLTPHHFSTLNSQYTAVADKDEYILYLAPELCNEYGLNEGEHAELYNELGSIDVCLVCEQNLPRDVVIIYQRGNSLKQTGINTLFKARNTDMGHFETGAPGLALNETFVNLRKKI